MHETPTSRWWELALNPKVVTAYYSDPPSLDLVEVHQVRLHRDAAVLELLIEMPTLADKPSPKWPKEFDTVQAELRFIGVRGVTLSGWGTTNIGRLLLERADEDVRFMFDSATIQLRGIAGWFDVSGISGYVKGAD